jgi:hypothetical protein
MYFFVNKDIELLECLRADSEEQIQFLEDLWNLSGLQEDFNELERIYSL